MAAEQDWPAYADQGYLLTTDTLLARTSAGAGVEVPGGALMALRSDGKTAEIKKAVPGADIKVRAWNASTGACGSYYETTTDTPNSFALFGIWDNAGAPHRSLACGSAVATAYDACDTHIWTAYSGSVKLLSNTANFRPGTDNGIPRGTRVESTVTYKTGKAVGGKSGKFELSFDTLSLGGKQYALRGTHRQEGKGNTVAAVFASLIISGRSAVMLPGQTLASALVV